MTRKTPGPIPEAAAGKTASTELRQPPSGGPQVACPACGKLSSFTPANPYRPFCSERCKVIDLGAWASDEYRIAGNPRELSSDDPDADLD